MITTKIITNTSTYPVVPVNNVEPTAAKGEGCAFLTFDQVLMLSTDDGATFPSALASWPGTLFPGAVKDSFFDQSVIWVPQTQRFIWAMVHSPFGATRQQIRIAYTSSSAAKSSGGREWGFLDVDPKQLGLADNFDYPQLLRSN